MDNLNKAYSGFVKEISRTISRDRIYTDDLRCLAWGTDAGFYRLLPKVVVRARDEEEVQLVLRTASELGLPVTFRAAGTSLSGQAITDSILLVAGKYWEKYRILDPEAKAIACQPGLIGQRVSDILAPYKRVFTPDPASSSWPTAPCSIPATRFPARNSPAPTARCSRKSSSCAPKSSPTTTSPRSSATSIQSRT